MDRGAWQATIHGDAKELDTTEHLNNNSNNVQFSHSVVSDSCDSMDHSPPGSSVHGISQAGILEWVVISSSVESSQPRG